MHLCEFIEDCEYNNLAVRILHLLGTEGPKTERPSRFIRYIYNRVVLENAIVRAAAVTALAKFGAWEGSAPSVKNSIKVLLTRCLDDPEDEVRDRAALNLKLLDNKEAAQKFINNGITLEFPCLITRFVVFFTCSGTEPRAIYFYRGFQ
jgi:coatomer subunit gamma